MSRFDEEVIKTVSPPKGIECETCIFSNDGTPFSNAPDKGCCQKYPYPKSKPYEVLFLKGHCPYYKEDANGR